MDLATSYPKPPVASHSDGLPQKVCHKCHTRIFSNYKFGCLAKDSNKTLLKHFSVCDIKNIDEKFEVDIEFKSESIKDEVVSESNDSINNDDSSAWKLEEDDDYNIPLKEYNKCSVLLMKADFEEKHEPTDLADFNDEDDGDSHETCEKAADVVKKKALVKKKTVGLKKKKKTHILLKQKPIEGKKKGLKICDVCGKLVINLVEHSKKHDAVRKTIPCGDCPKTFFSYGARSRHRKNYHLNRIYYCEICKKYYKAGKDHQKKYHSGIVMEKRFECHLCNRKFGNKTHLAIHMTTHTQEKAFKCDLCDKYFKTKNSCYSHRKEIHEGVKEHVCHYCSKAFYLRTRLKFHLTSHTKESHYKCEDCGKMFRTPMTLRNHKNLHVGVKNVKCKLCDSAFYNTGGLRSHMLSHTKEKKHPCKYCGIMFGRTDHRNRHQKTAHEDKLK